MEAEHVQKVNKLLNELNRMNHDFERIGSEITELSDEYDSLTELSDRAGVSANALDAKLEKILDNADYEVEQVEDGMLKLVAYLNKFTRTATKGLMAPQDKE